MLLFLDLEETLIDSWEGQNLLVSNIEKIREEFSRFNDPVEGLNNAPVLGLMSWAVWNDDDKKVFNEKLRPAIEEALGMTFADELVWSMDDWSWHINRSTGKRVSRDDLFDMFGKQEVLFVLSRHSHNFNRQKVFLVDDAVEHGLEWFSPENECSVEILNIKESWV